MARGMRDVAALSRHVVRLRRCLRQRERAVVGVEEEEGGDMAGEEMNR